MTTKTTKQNKNAGINHDTLRIGERGQQDDVPCGISAWASTPPGMDTT